MSFYILTILVFACINGIIALGFNFQFGISGVINLAYYVLVAVGAYATGVAALGPPQKGTLSYWVGGLHLGFPWDVFFGVLCTVVFALLLAGLALRRLRHDYLALTLVSVGLGLLYLVQDDVKLFNGEAGIANFPTPFNINFAGSSYQYVFLGISAVGLVVTYALLERLTKSPLGRALKAVRDDEEAAASLGKDVWRLKLFAFMVGAFAAGLGGALLGLYVSGWNTQSWAPQETLGILAAVVIGGRGNNLGALVGQFITLEAIVQATQFLPAIGGERLLPQFQLIAIGVLTLAFLRWRPQGIIPERKERFPNVGDLRREATSPVSVAEVDA